MLSHATSCALRNQVPPAHERISLEIGSAGLFLVGQHGREPVRRKIIEILADVAISLLDELEPDLDLEQDDCELEQDDGE